MEPLKLASEIDIFAIDMEIAMEVLNAAQEYLQSNVFCKYFNVHQGYADGAMNLLVATQTLLFRIKQNMEAIREEVYEQNRKEGAK